MTLLPMMRGGAAAMAIATAMLVQGCGTAVPTQVAFTDPGQSTGPYSGTAWYADLNHVMTTDSGGQ
jgi:hypothetical protein